nr:S8 family serine peptidase [Anaeromicropila populeti]
MFQRNYLTLCRIFCVNRTPAGNGGPKPKTIGAPGISRKIITVGASDDDVSVDLMGSTAKNYSGRGPTEACVKKPDIVAPGSNIVSCNLIRRNTGFLWGIRPSGSYIAKSGTSMSTPIVSGAIALLLCKYPDMTTREVKIRIKNCAEDLGWPHEKQGWGLLNIEKLLK